MDPVNFDSLFSAAEARQRATPPPGFQQSRSLPAGAGDLKRRAIANTISHRLAPPGEARVGGCTQGRAAGTPELGRGGRADGRPEPGRLIRSSSCRDRTELMRGGQRVGGMVQHIREY
jgi:hypothetical protein